MKAITEKTPMRVKTAWGGCIDVIRQTLEVEQSDVGQTRNSLNGSVTQRRRFTESDVGKRISVTEHPDGYPSSWCWSTEDA